MKNKNIGLKFLVSGSFDTWNPPDFMKSGWFQVKSTQNLVKAGVSTKTIQFDECKRGAMTLDFMKSGVIAPSMHPPNWRVFVETSDFIRLWVDFTWNPLNFTWNPPDFMNVSFCVMIKYRSFDFRKTKYLRFFGLGTPTLSITCPAKEKIHERSHVKCPDDRIVKQSQ